MLSRSNRAHLLTVEGAYDVPAKLLADIGVRTPCANAGTSPPVAGVRGAPMPAGLTTGSSCWLPTSSGAPESTGSSRQTARRPWAWAGAGRGSGSYGFV